MTKVFFHHVDRGFMMHSEYREDFDKASELIASAFNFDPDKNCTLPDHISNSHTANSFEYRLKSFPNDLSCHLQRIQVFATEKNKTGLFISICDLFIVLGTQRLSLRQRLVASCKAVLDKQQTAFLELYLTEKLAADTDALPGSCLFKERSSQLSEPETETQIVSKTKAPEDVLYIAESYIKNSQFDTALKYMQKQLLKNPKNKALTIKLISLYKALNCTDKFQNAYTKFSNNVTTSLYWKNAKQHFTSQ